MVDTLKSPGYNMESRVTMEKKYAIQCRIITKYPNGKLVRGGWQIWKRYKTIMGLIEAWDYYKTKKWAGVWNKSNGEMESSIVWQFRPINLSDEKQN